MPLHKALANRIIHCDDEKQCAYNHTFSAFVLKILATDSENSSKYKNGVKFDVFINYYCTCEISMIFFLNFIIFFYRIYITQSLNRTFNHYTNPCFYVFESSYTFSHCGKKHSFIYALPMEHIYFNHCLIPQGIFDTHLSFY